MLTNISLTVYPQKIYSNENKLNHSSLKVYMTLQNFFNVKIICSLVPCTSFQYYSRTLLFLLLLCKINIVQINYEKHCYLFPEKKWNNRVPKDLVLVKWQFNLSEAIKNTQDGSLRAGIQSTSLNPSPFSACLSVPNYDLDFQCRMSLSPLPLFRVHKVRGYCLFCWYWWNCWPSLHKLSFHSMCRYSKPWWVRSWWLIYIHVYIHIYLVHFYLTHNPV